MWPMPNVMAALLNIHRALCCMPQSLADATTGLLCSNTDNIGERKTWTQSEFCTWQLGKSPRKCIYTVPAQEMTKHRAKFGFLPFSDVAAVTKPRRETH